MCWSVVLTAVEKALFSEYLERSVRLERGKGGWGEDEDVTGGGGEGCGKKNCQIISI